MTKNLNSLDQYTADQVGIRSILRITRNPGLVGLGLWGGWRTSWYGATGHRTYFLACTHSKAWRARNQLDTIRRQPGGILPLCWHFTPHGLGFRRLRKRGAVSMTKCKKRGMMLFEIEDVQSEQFGGTPKAEGLAWSGVQLPVILSKKSS